MGLGNNDLSRWDLHGQNLTGANFYGTTLSGVDFADAEVKGADFSYSIGLTKEQLYSTATYKGKDLGGTRFWYDDLSGCDLHGQNLTKADFYYATLTGAILAGANMTMGSFYGADLRGANLQAADMTRADMRGAALAGADFHDAVVKGAWLDATTANGFTKEQLYSTASYKNRDLGSIRLGRDLTGWDLHSQNMKGASLHFAILTNANFTDAIVRGADFTGTTAYGFTKSQLYSTASYKSKDLRDIVLVENNLSGWDLHAQNLTFADFTDSTLAGVDTSFADLRGANVSNTIGTPIRHNTIWVGGYLWLDNSTYGMHLASGDELAIRNYNMAITDNGSWKMDEGSKLKMVLEGDWRSIMNVGDGVVPDLGGTLELAFAEGIDPASLIGTEFRLFNWNGRLTASDSFHSLIFAPGTSWDTSRLYTDGIVTLVPEPMTLGLLACGGLALRRIRR
jgi:uncharacterized protein YjbI with pentapeptide repeats